MKAGVSIAIAAGSLMLLGFCSEAGGQSNANGEPRDASNDGRIPSFNVLSNDCNDFDDNIYAIPCLI